MAAVIMSNLKLSDTSKGQNIMRILFNVTVAIGCVVALAVASRNLNARSSSAVKAPSALPSDAQDPAFSGATIERYFAGPFR